MNAESIVMVTAEDRRIFRMMYQDYLERSANRGASLPPIDDIDNGSNWYLARAVETIPAATADDSPGFGKVALDLLSLPTGASLTNPVRTVTPAKLSESVDATIPNAYNLSLTNSYGTGERLWVVRLANGPYVIVPFSGKAGSGGGGSGGCCGCSCIDVGDIEVGGVRTTSRWLAAIGQVNERQENGVITIQADEHSLEWDDTEGCWIGEVDPDLISAKYLDGTDATAATSATAEIVLKQNDGGYTTLTITITGTVPAPS